MTLRCLSVMRDDWSLVRRRRMARVFFTRRSRGWYLWRTEAALHCLGPHKLPERAPLESGRRSGR